MWFLKSINIKFLLLRHIDVKNVRIIVHVRIVEYIVSGDIVVTASILHSSLPL